MGTPSRCVLSDATAVVVAVAAIAEAVEAAAGGGDNGDILQYYGDIEGGGGGAALPSLLPSPVAKFGTYRCMFDCGFEDANKQRVEAHELSCSSMGAPYSAQRAGTYTPRIARSTR